jgi:hypothetical protein
MTTGPLRLRLVTLSAGVTRWVKPAMDAAFAVPVLAAVAWAGAYTRPFFSST